MDQGSAGARRNRHQHALALGAAAVVLAGGLAVAAHFASRCEDGNRQRLVYALEAQTHLALDRAQERMSHLDRGLAGARSAVLADDSGTVSAATFRAFAQGRDLAAEYPGFRGLGFVQRLGDHEVVQLIEPLAGNGELLGLDLGADAPLRAAAEAALRSGRPAMSPPLAASGTRAGCARCFLVLLPVYFPGVALSDAAQRDRATIGWMFAAVDAREVFSGIGISADLQLQFRDVTAAGERGVSFSLGQLESSPLAELPRGEVLDMYGRRWVVAARAGARFASRLNPDSPGTVFAVGACLAVLAAALAAALTRLAALRRADRDRRIEQQRGQLERVWHDLRAIADAFPSMIGYWDRNLINRFANRAYEKWFGVDARAMSGRHLQELLGPELFDRNRGRIEAALRGESVSFELDLPVRSEGTMSRVLAHYIPDRQGGEVCGFYVMVHDITALHDARQRLAQGDAILERVSEIAGVGGFCVDLATGRQTWTDRTFRIYEWEGGAAPTVAEMDALVHADGLGRLRRGASEPLAPGQVIETEMPMRTRRGRLIWVRAASRVEFEDGRAVRVIGAVQDVTERRLAAEALRATGERLALATGAAGMGIWEWDLRSNALDWDAQTYRLHGYPDRAGTVPKGFWVDCLHLADRARLMQEIRRARGGEAKFSAEYRAVMPHGQTRYLDVRAQVVRDADGAPLRMVGLCIDVTERKEAELALVQSEAKFRSLFELSPVGFALTDMQSGRFLHLNSALAAPTGYARDELLRMSQQDITPERYRETDVAQAESLEQWDQYGPYEKEYRRKDGSTYPVLLSGIRASDPTGRAVVWSIVHDISQRKAVETQLAEAARRDSLTGLANRVLFMERLEAAVTRVRDGTQAYFAVLFLDFDRFKLINDTLGHEAGDELLRQIADRLRMDLRASDTRHDDLGGNVVSRFGGDEFLLLINNLKEPGDAVRIAERLLNALASAYDIHGSEVHSSASIGIVTSAQCLTSAEDVVRNADVAMYEAKRAGRGCSVVFNEAMHTRLARHVMIETSLRRAIGTAELHLEYQPIVELATGRVVSAEALVRWSHPTLGRIPPSEFIPIAEESGLIVALGQWVQSEACQALVRWQAQEPRRAPPTISVNVSRAELALGGQLLKQLREMLDRVGLPAHCLQLEVTEREAMRNPEASLRLMHELQRLGVKLAMDDFGTGTSSLGFLRNYPFNTIKIDRSFVQDLTGRPDVLAVIHATINLVENLGMASLAEGVEDASQVAILQSLGCRFAQGYFFSPPVTEERFLDAVASVPRAAAAAGTPELQSAP